MKKIFSLLFLTVALMALALSFASCKKEEAPAEPEHVHTEGEAVRENEVAATCTKEGSYDLVTYCTECSEEISREAKTISKAKHTASKAVKEEYKAVTCTTNETYKEVVYCSVCKYKMSTKTVTGEKAKGHVEAEPVIEVYEVTCTKNGHTDTVVYCQNCTYVFSRSSTTDATALGHTYMEPVIENYYPKSCCNDGHYDVVKYCSTCGADSRTTITIERHDHTPGEEVIENENKEEYLPTCTSLPKHDIAVYCTECNSELSRQEAVEYGEMLPHVVADTTVQFTFNCENEGFYTIDLYCEKCTNKCDETNIFVKAKHTEDNGIVVSVTELDKNEQLNISYEVVVYCVHDDITYDAVEVIVSKATDNE